MLFSDLGLSQNILKAITDLGFATPMPIQELSIPILLEKDTDFVGLAQTGTGKTAAFGLPLLEKIDESQRVVQALILCPTRELCMQITKDLRNYAKYMPDVLIVPVYGGASIEVQFKELARKPQIIVATPGRLQDMIRRNRVDFTNVKTMVLDEADEMLNMGFQEEVDAILEYMPKEKHTYLFSATMPKEVEAILNKYMTEPQRVSVGQRNSGTVNVDHRYYMMAAKDRYAVLKRLIDYTPSIYGIIFCRTKLETQEVADSLLQDGYNAASLHGDLSQALRDNVMNNFRKKSVQILVATDVAARGIDVSDLTHIINYNLPDDIETYVHRSGRTGRADKRGVCISLINLREKGKIKRIEKILGRPIERATIPTGKEVCEKQLFKHIDRIEHVDINREDIDDYLPVIFKKLSWMTREELITRMVALNFNRFLDYYRNAIDLNVDEKEEKRGRDKEERRKDPNRDKGLKRIYFGLGKADHMLPQKIIVKINDVTRTKDIRIGRIDLFEHHSFVDVEEKHIPLILECFADPRRNPQGIVVELAGDQKNTEGKHSDRHDDRGRDDRQRKRKDRDRKNRDRDDKSYFKVERSRDGREWLEGDNWVKERFGKMEAFFDDDDDRPKKKKKKKSDERSFSSKKKKSGKESKQSRRGAGRNR